MAKANYKSALHHLNMLEGDVEARNLRIQQVKAAIPKGDEAARAELAVIAKKYEELDTKIAGVKEYLGNILAESETPED